MLVHRTKKLLVSFTSIGLAILGAQWLSGRVLDMRPRGSGIEPHQRHCILSLSKCHINPSLVLVQARKTRLYITERLLMGHKRIELNKQTCAVKKLLSYSHYMLHYSNYNITGLDKQNF